MIRSRRTGEQPSVRPVPTLATSPRRTASIERDATARDEGTARLTLHTFATTVASNVALGGVSIVIARALGPSEKGAYDLVLATATLLATLLGLSLPTGITYVVARGRAGVRRLIRRTAGLTIVQAALAAGLLVAIRNSAVASAFVPPDIDATVVWATLFFVAFTLLQSNSRAVLMGRRAIVRANRLDLLGGSAQFAIFVVAILAMRGLAREPRAVHFVWFAVSAVALSCAFFFRAAYVAEENVPTRASGLAEVWRYALTCHLGNIAQFLNYRVAIFLIGFFLGTASVGLYTVAMTLSQLNWLVAQAAATVLLPLVASRVGAGDDSALHVAAATRTVVGITCALALATAAAAGPVVPWVFGAEFEGSVLPLYLLLPGIVAFVPSIVLASYFGGHGLPRINLKGSLAGLVTILVLSVALIPRLGTAGAAIATSGACLVSSIVLLFSFSRSTRISPWAVVVPRRGDVAAVNRALIQRVGVGLRGDGR